MNDRKDQNTTQFSIVVPAYNTPDKYLIPMIDSVLAQTFERWQLCLVQGGSTDPDRADAIRKQAARDNRITLVDLKENAGIAGNTNAGIAAAKGKYIAFLDHDDTLSSDALYEAYRAIRNYPEIDLIYSDEDKLSDDGKHTSMPFLKPDWSPELFTSVNYISHFVIVRKDIVDGISGLREGYDGAQDYDFLLRIVEQQPVIHHIPKVLYHWRMAEGSTARSIGEKNYADEHGQAALRDYLKRNNIDAKVLGISERPTNYRVKFSIPAGTKASIIIPFKDKADLLKTCIESIQSKTSYKNYEIILVSNNSSEQATYTYLKSLESYDNIIQIVHDEPFNYSQVNNVGAAKASGDVLIFLNNDTEVINPEWLEELVGVAVQPKVGAVGPMLLYPDNTIQHAGVIVGLLGTAGHVFRGLKPGTLTDYGLPDWPRNYLAVTGACLAIKHDLFKSLKGFDENFIICGSDVALGIEAFRAGHRNVYWPYAQLYHYESKSVISYDNAPRSDYDNSIKYYQPYLFGKDPYFNKGLDLNREQPTKKGRVMIRRNSRLGKALWILQNEGALVFGRKVVSKSVKKAKKTVRQNSGNGSLTKLDEAVRYVGTPLFQIDRAMLAANNAIVSHPYGDAPKSAAWFVPYFDHITFGGIYTIFRFISSFAEKGVANTIIIYDNKYVDVPAIQKQIKEHFPVLAGVEIVVLDLEKDSIESLPPCDIGVATIWMSAYALLRYNQTKAKYYFVQDYEPLFYEGGSIYALAEDTYRWGFTGIVNTPGLANEIKVRHDMKAVSFTPCVDNTYYYPKNRQDDGQPTKIFFYTRPNNPRNAFEMCINIMLQLKERYGDKVEIVTAGSDWNESQYGLSGRIRNLGLLGSLKEVGDLYRNMDVGVVYMLSKHPSYQPFEFMASGMATVTNMNEANTWMLKNRENCLVANPSPTAFVEAIGELVEDKALRSKIAKNGLSTVSTDWHKETENIWEKLFSY